MLVSGIKSKPVYSPLRADTTGRYHWMLGVGVGAAPLLRVLAELRTLKPDALSATRVLYTPGATIDAATDVDSATSVAPAVDAGSFAAAGVAETRWFADEHSLLAACRTVLETAFMGTRLYVAGPESFIGLAMQQSLEFNLNPDEIRAEECGSRARRVWCVHCRRIAEQVTTNIVRCPGCERWLLVRDHYSRRLAAYMGVMVDAEAPGELPPIRTVFQ